MSPSTFSKLDVHGSVLDSEYSNNMSTLKGQTAVLPASGASSDQPPEFLLDRHLHRYFPVVTGGKGSRLFLEDGRTIFDATSGAAVSCLGHGNEQVIEAVHRQMSTGIPYLASTFWSSNIVEDLCRELIDGTGREMAKVYLTGSGSEAMEAALKLARQYFIEQDQNTSRINFIAREGSYHGNTLGALAVSGHVSRRAPYLPLLAKNIHHVSACNAYRQRSEGESDASFVAKKVAELEAKFHELDPGTVIAFIVEPIVGAALGCVPAVPGYLKAMKDVCHKYGALFILDEVMSGMGRSGTLHAWQNDGVCPDIETIGKGLAGGYQPVAAVLISSKVVNALASGSGQFVHGQTYQGMPVQAAAALQVQRIIREENLLENVAKQGAYLEKLLRSHLANHPHVGDIRGRGLFWGLEFVKDKMSKDSFIPSLRVAQKVSDVALAEPFNMMMYPGTGTAGGDVGDHVILAPPYNVTGEDVEHIARVTADVIRQVFEQLEQN